jgi:hypothetical protein
MCAGELTSGAEDADVAGGRDLRLSETWMKHSLDEHQLPEDHVLSAWLATRSG